MQLNQQIRFFSDVQLYLNPEAEHYLDWFHITMRITVMGQYAKLLKTTPEKREEGLNLLESMKHYLWHGNVVRANELHAHGFPAIAQHFRSFDEYANPGRLEIPLTPAKPKRVGVVATSNRKPPLRI